MKVLIVEPNKKPYLEDIDSSLTSMQTIVQGMIQTIYPYEDMVAIVCNDEGKLIGLDLNRALKTESGELYDIIAGPFFICGLNTDSFTSLTDDLAVKYYEKFKYPEIFGYSKDHEIVSQKCIIDNTNQDLFPLSENETIKDLLSMPGFKRLNTHSILSKEKFEKHHHIENEEMIQYLKMSPDFQRPLVVKTKFYDIANRNSKKKVQYEIINSIDQLDNLIHSNDLKNGWDLGISSDEGLAIAIYGSGYEYHGINDNVKAIVTIHPTIDEIDSDFLNTKIPDFLYVNINKMGVEKELLQMKKEIEKSLKRKKSKTKDARMI